MELPVFPPFLKLQLRYRINLWTEFLAKLMLLQAKKMILLWLPQHQKLLKSESQILPLSQLLAFNRSTPTVQLPFHWGLHRRWNLRRRPLRQLRKKSKKFKFHGVLQNKLQKVQKDQQLQNFFRIRFKCEKRSLLYRPIHPQFKVCLESFGSWFTVLEISLLFVKNFSQVLSWFWTLIP